MKRFIALLACSVCSFFTLNGQTPFTTVTGGALTYEYVGNSQFVFTLQITTNCNNDFSSVVSSTTLSNGTTMSLDTSYSLDLGCIYPCDTSSPANQTSSILCVYKSAPVTVPIPANGVEEFVWLSVTYRNPQNANISNDIQDAYFSAKMYAAGYPRSSPQVKFVGSDNHPTGTDVELKMPSYSITGDSLHRLLTPTLNVNGNAKNYISGLSATFPLDGFIGFDSNSGAIEANGLIVGRRYYVAQKVQSFSSFGLSSELIWERGYYAPTFFPTVSDTAELSVSHDPNLQLTSNVDSTYLSVYVNRGDTGMVHFKLTSDVGNPLEYKVTSSSQLGTDINVVNDPGYVNPSPVLPQIEFTLEWMPDSVSQVFNSVVLTGHDYSCPGVPVVVVVDLFTNPLSTTPDTVIGCNGGVAYLPTAPVPNGDWVPTANVTKLNASTYTTVPGQPELLTYFVNGVPLQSAWVIGVTLPNPTFGQVSGGPGLTNASQFEGADWYYFDVLVDTNILSLPASSGWGNYQARAFVGQCEKWSPISAYQRPNSVLTQFIKDTLATEYETLPVGTQMSWLLEKDSPGNLWPQSIIFPGARGSGQLAIEIDSSGVVIYSDTTESFGPYAKRITFPHAFEGVNLLYMNGSKYTYRVTVIDADVEVPIGDEFVNAEYYGGFMHKNNTGLPTASTRFMPFVLQAYSGVGLNELNAANWSVYPNPAAGHLYVDGLEIETAYTIINQVGQAVQYGTISDQPISLNTLANGIYFIQVGDHFEKFVVARP
ncbi:MAG: T9SS type A sorting domain-containing protein [Flavobacteriia bacterium]|nr:T9SS type A sorting domain-containing protein [Flavobacteriia bacterium]